MTLQVFYKPKNMNYSRGYPHIISLRPVDTEEWTFNMKHFYSNKTLYSQIAGLAMVSQRNDLYFSKVINESVITFKTGADTSSYQVIHDNSESEGWLSYQRNSGRRKISDVENSVLMIGHDHFTNGENITDVIDQLNTLSEDEEVQKLIHTYTSGFIGEIQQIALYCRHVTQSEVLRGEYEDTKRIKVTPRLDSEPTKSEKIAVRLLSLITKKKIPIDAEVVAEAAALIDQGDYKQAALLGVNLPGFYNNTVKEFALKMSNREETVDVPLNDMAATIIGAVRDQTDARELLTGNFYYRADPLAGVPSEIVRNMLTSNKHYEGLDSRKLDLKKALVIAQPQKLLANAGAVTDHPDPSGVLTSRAFLSAHASAGTNRRIVEYAFKQFMCVDLSDMSDTEASDLRVGRDIDRFPAGSHKKYQTSCKGCHTVMDGFRGAFAKVDFDISQAFVKYADYHPMNTKEVSGVEIIYPENISYKVNHNEFSYPSGFVTTDDSFYNFANLGANKILFGWRTPATKGFGMGQFGKMLAKSQRFSKCMVKRVFESVCPVIVKERTLSKLSAYVTDFEKYNYNLKNLFLNAAISPLCLGSN